MGKTFNTNIMCPAIIYDLFMIQLSLVNFLPGIRGEIVLRTRLRLYEGCFSEGLIAGGREKLGLGFLGFGLLEFLI